MIKFGRLDTFVEYLSLTGSKCEIVIPNYHLSKRIQDSPIETPIARFLTIC
jgi:hypothetical protein